MQKRGRILRDPIPGPGLLIVEGQQYPFSLEGVWKSDLPPTVGMIVDVDFNPSLAVVAVRSVPESQLAKEQAEVVLVAARQKGAALASGALAKFGAPNLIAAGLLIIGWFFLTSVSIKSPFGSIDFNFWQVLGYLNAGNAFEALMRGGQGGLSTGLYGFAAIASIAGPFISYFWKDRRAVLAGMFPLLFMAFVLIAVRSSLSDALGTGAVPQEMREMAEQARAEAMKAVSIGFGTYLSAITSVYLAVVSAKQFLVSRATGANGSSKTQSAAA
jgi:hypothetical protein